MLVALVPTDAAAPGDHAASPGPRRHRAPNIPAHHDRLLLSSAREQLALDALADRVADATVDPELLRLAAGRLGRVGTLQCSRVLAPGNTGQDSAAWSQTVITASNGSTT